MKETYRKLVRIVVHNVLHTDDTPHQLALGVAVGLLVGFLPIMGIQMVVCVGLAALLRANKAIGVPIVWITNPITFVPIYGACLALGQWVLPKGESTVSASEVFALLQRDHGLSELFTLTFWEEFASWSITVGLELWVGCGIVGFATAIPGYFLTRRLVTGLRVRHKLYIERRKVRAQRREMRRTRLSKATGPA